MSYVEATGEEIDIGVRERPRAWIVEISTAGDHGHADRPVALGARQSLRHKRKHSRARVLIIRMQVSGDISGGSGDTARHCLTDVTARILDQPYLPRHRPR